MAISANQSTFSVFFVRWRDRGNDNKDLGARLREV